MKRLFLLFGIFAALTFSVNAQTKLVAQYKFDHEGADSIAKDATANALDLVISNVGDDTWSDAGVVNGCFNPARTSVAATDDDTLFQVQSFTFATYLRINPENKATANYIMTQGDNYGLWVMQDGGLRFYIHFLAPDNSSGWVGTNAADVNLKDGYWHHVAVSFDTTDLVATFYVDGEVAASDTVRNTGTQLAPPPHSIIWYKWDGFYLGGSNENSKYVDGSMDEAVFFSGKLSATDIKSMVATRYSLTTHVTGEGVIDPADGEFFNNDTLLLHAIPSVGGIFKIWQIKNGGTSADNPLKIVVNDDVEVTAEFGTTLIARYKFDNEGADTVALDASDNGLNLVLNDSTGWSDAGVVNGCLNTEGSIYGVTDADSLFRAESFTFAAYVRIDPSNASTNYIMTQGDNYGLSVMNNGALRFYIHYLAPDSTAGWVGTNAEGVNVKDGYWHHVAVTFDNSDLVASIYLDGDVVASDTVRKTSTGKTPPVNSHIWYKWGGFVIANSTEGQHLDGSIDEAVFYASKLSEKDIKKMVAERYTLTIHIEGEGKTEPSGGKYYANDTLNILAVPDIGGSFKQWTIGGSTYTVNPLSLTISGDVDLTAEFGSTLVAQYKFDNEGADTVALDASDNGINLVLNDSTGWSDAGVVNGCLNTGGQIEGVTEDDTLFQVQSLTFASYIRIDPSNTSANYIMTQGDNYGLWVMENGALRFYIHYLAPDSTAGWVGTNAEGVNVKDGYWHHVAVTFDTTDLVATLYLDGDTVACDTVRNSGSGLTPPAHSVIWYKWDGFYVGSGMGSNYVDGSIDEAVFFNARLAGEEIRKMIVNRFSLTTGITGNGNVSPADGLFYPNDTLMLTAVADEGWEFDKWDETGTVTGTDNPVTVVVNADIVANAVFKESTGIPLMGDNAGISLYPNPFDNEITISYNLENSTRVRVSVFNSVGQLVSVILDARQSAGNKTVYWNGNRTKGDVLRSGIYFIRLQFDDKSVVRKVIKR